MKNFLPFHLFYIFILLSCSNLKKHPTEIRKNKPFTNKKPIVRNSGETFFPIKPLCYKKTKTYPWQASIVGGYQRITIEHFRCKGRIQNHPIQIFRKKDFLYHFDCGGIDNHTLPMKNGKEYIYPILIDLLNFVQEKLQKKVIITSGHRCPAHNSYCDISKKNQLSKHQVGAEVDFYVEGLEKDPNTVIETLNQFYTQKMNRSITLSSSSTPSWYNHEVAITLYHIEEGRDFDNSHNFPYISIQVLYDTIEKKKVTYNWHKAYNEFIKHYE